MGYFDLIDDIYDDFTNTVEEFIDDPIGKTVDTTLQPINDVIYVVDGLTVGELRTKAILRLGAEIAVGMSTEELIEWYNNA